MTNKYEIMGIIEEVLAERCKNYEAISPKLPWAIAIDILTALRKTDVIDSNMYCELFNYYRSKVKNA